MKIKVLIFIIFSSTLLPAQKPRIAYKEGIIAHANNENTKAIKLFTIAINSHRKKFKPAYFMRGDSYEKLGNSIYAIDDYISAYENYPDKISLGNKISRMLNESKSYSQSLIFVNKTLSIDSTNFNALKLKAIDQVYLGNFEQALVTCDYASTLKTDAELTYAKALASDSLKLTDYAFAYYRKAIIEDSLADNEGNIRYEIKAIAPLIEEYAANTLLYEKPMFWLNFEELKQVLSLEPFVSKDNMDGRLKYDFYFDKRKFVSQTLGNKFRFTDE